jgi:hypothetical protein
MAATVIAVTAAGIIQGMVTDEVDTAATVMGGAATPVMAEPTAVHIAEVAAFRVVTEEAGSLVAVDTEAGGTVRKLVQEQRTVDRLLKRAIVRTETLLSLKPSSKAAGLRSGRINGWRLARLGESDVVYHCVRALLPKPAALKAPSRLILEFAMPLQYAWWPES